MKSSFDDIENEFTSFFNEAHLLLIHLKELDSEKRSQLHSKPLPTTSQLEKMLKGLFIVAIYASVEKAINLITDTAIYNISKRSAINTICAPSLYSIFYNSLLSSMTNCSSKKIIDKSKILFNHVLDGSPMQIGNNNPLSKNLQNVDFETITWLLSIFDLNEIKFKPDSAGRLNNIKERRNAVSHGRELSSEVGQRFSLNELENIQQAATDIIWIFFEEMKIYCIKEKYIIR